jgi:hypothetical protein
MTLNEAADLKKRMLETTDFPEFHDYYFTNFAEKESFRKLGRPLSTPRTDGIFHMIAEAYVAIGGPRLVNMKGLLIEIREAHLVHGALFVDGQLTTVLYFTDVKVGMCTIAGSRGGKDMDKYIRFSADMAKTEQPN